MLSKARPAVKRQGWPSLAAVGVFLTALCTAAAAAQPAPQAGPLQGLPDITNAADAAVGFAAADAAAATAAAATAAATGQRPSTTPPPPRPAPPRRLQPAPEQPLPPLQHPRPTSGQLAGGGTQLYPAPAPGEPAQLPAAMPDAAAGLAMTPPPPATSANDSTIAGSGTAGEQQQTESVDPGYVSAAAERHAVTTGIIIAAAVGSVVGALAVALATIIVVRRRRQRRHTAVDAESPPAASAGAAAGSGGPSGALISSQLPLSASLELKGMAAPSGLSARSVARTPNLSGISSGSSVGASLRLPLVTARAESPTAPTHAAHEEPHTAPALELTEVAAEAAPGLTPAEQAVLAAAAAAAQAAGGLEWPPPPSVQVSAAVQQQPAVAAAAVPTGEGTSDTVTEAAGQAAALLLARASAAAAQPLGAEAAVAGIEGGVASPAAAGQADSLMRRGRSLPWGDEDIRPTDITILHKPDGSPWVLGTGAYGMVYKALRDGVQPVAVKILRGMHDERLREEFMREVALLRACRDRNIVQFIGACLQDDTAFLVTEYMELGDLWRAVTLRRQDGTRVFSWQGRGRRVLLDVACGLHYLHSHRVVHFDLKSANILLARDGTAKLADVGFARLLSKSHLSCGTGSASLIGTWAWCAPEVLYGQRCTEKSDIFSLGVVIWEVCTGETPVRGSMRPLVPGVDCPPEVVALYQRCTSQDPALRPTAKEVVRALQSWSGPEAAGGKL